MVRHGIRSKITRVFITQLLLISLATVIGVYGSARVVENVLIKKALESEAEHFWSLYEQGNDVTEPNTANLIGYLAVAENYTAVPQELHHVQTGYGRVALAGENPIVHVSDKNDARLFLVFNEQQVSDLAFYFGVVPLAIVLLILYIVAWVAYRQSHRAVSPIVQLANLVKRFDFKNQTLDELDLDRLAEKADAEVLAMIKAFQQFTQRLENYIDREQQFTRDASHELRTPLAVIKGSVDLLLKSEHFDELDIKAINRIQRTTKDMESLVETLLMLAREENNKLPTEKIILNDLLQELAKNLQIVYSSKAVTIEVIGDNLLEVNASEKVLSILFSNLLRNAYNYTQQGKIRIIIRNTEVIVEDSGMGMSEVEVQSAFKPFYRATSVTEGHGLGLAIVKRLCDRFSWGIKVSSIQNQGTVVTLTFHDATLLGRRSKV